MKVERFTFGPFETNTYVVTDEQGILLIDPACAYEWEQQELFKYIQRLTTNDQRPITIIATHGHLDHLWGAKWATETWNTPVLMHEADIPMVQAMQEQYNLFGVRRTAEPFPVKGIQSTEHRTQTDLQIIETPGHTPGSMCLYFPKDKILFSGDTLFRMGYGRTDLPGGNMGQLISSLEQLFTLPPDIRVFPGHGEMTTIGEEKR
jgi:glyoxylase-like metal-dependent hydrolase (beta-lactamase superfamily II)